MKTYDTINNFKEFPMPQITTAISSIEETLIKPIMVSVCKYIMSNIGINQSVEFEYIDYTGRVNTLSQGVKLKSKDRISFISKEIPTPDNFLNNSANVSSGRYPLYKDEEISASFVTATTLYDVTITAVYTSLSKATMKNWINRYLAMLTNGILDDTFDLQFSYPLSDEAIVLLGELNRVKNIANNTEITLWDYMKSKLASNHTFKVNSSGTKFTIEFPEVLHNLVLVKPTEIPDIGKDDSGYSIELEFTFQADIPTSISALYPNFIGPYPLDKSFIDLSKDYNLPNGKYPSGNEAAHIRGTQSMLNYYVRDYGFVVPRYDSFKMDLSQYRLRGILQVKFGYNSEDPYLICNLNDLLTIRGFEYHPDIKKYLLEHKDVLFTPGKVLLSLIIIRKTSLISHTTFYIDDNLDIRCTNELAPLGDYHIILATDSNIKDISRPKLETMTYYPDLLNKLILFGQTKLTPKDLPPIMIGNDAIISEGNVDTYLAAPWVQGGVASIGSYLPLFNSLPTTIMGSNEVPIRANAIIAPV